MQLGVGVWWQNSHPAPLADQKIRNDNVERFCDQEKNEYG
jgi:hypothetical protein